MFVCVTVCVCVIVCVRVCVSVCVCVFQYVCTYVQTWLRSFFPTCLAFLQTCWDFLAGAITYTSIIGLRIVRTLYAYVILY